MATGSFFTIQCSQARIGSAGSLSGISGPRRSGRSRARTSLPVRLFASTSSPTTITGAALRSRRLSLPQVCGMNW